MNWLYILGGVYLGIGIASAIHASFWAYGWCSAKSYVGFVLATIVMWPSYWFEFGKE